MSSVSIVWAGKVTAPGELSEEGDCALHVACWLVAGGGWRVGATQGRQVTPKKGTVVVAEKVHNITRLCGRGVCNLVKKIFKNRLYSQLDWNQSPSQAGLREKVLHGWL